MAKNQNITDQQELNRLTREYETMLNRVNSLRARIGQNPIRLLAPEETGNIQALTSAIKTLADESSALNEQLSEAKKSFEGLNDEIKEFGEHLEKQNKGIEDLVNSFKTVAEEIKTLTGDLSKIELPTLTQRIGYDLGDIPAAPLPELSTPIDKIVNIVVKGVEEAEATFSRLAEPFSRIVSIEQAGQAQVDPERIRELASSADPAEIQRILTEIRRAGQDFTANGVSLQDAFRELAGAISDAGTAADSSFSRSLKAGRQLRNITQDLRSDVEGFTKLSLKELETKQRQYYAQKGILELNKALLDQELNSLQRRVDAGETLSSTEQSRYDRLRDISNISNESFARIEAQLAGRIKQEKEINYLMGAGGALLKGTETFLKNLGISSHAFGAGIEKAQEAMRATAERSLEVNSLQERRAKLEEEIAKARRGHKRSSHLVAELNTVNEQLEKAGPATGRLGVLMSGLGPAASAFGTALTDPLAIIGRIAAEFINVNKAAVELQRLTGTNESSAAGANSRLITSVEYLKTAAELTKEIGLAANAIFDSAQLAALSEAQKLLGLSAQQTANLGMRAKFVGDTVDGFQDSILAGADAANRMGKSAVAPGIVLQDVLNTSEDISLSLGQNPKALGKAAVAARAFGLTLEQVSNIADGLLDFESSIEAELEAQLLTGKNIQLSRARELALVNDLEGMSKELANQGVRAADFANMTRIQQESVAKALGMSREQLAKSLVAQAAQGELTDDQRAAVLGVTREQLAQLDVQQKLQDSLTKLAQAFTPMLDILIPFVELLSYPIKLIAGLIGGIFNFIDGFRTTGEEANKFVNALVYIGKLLTGGAILGGLALLRNGIKGIGAGIKEAFKLAPEGQGFLKTLKSGITAPIKSLTEGFSAARAGGQGFFKSIGSGFKNLTSRAATPPSGAGGTVPGPGGSPDIAGSAERAGQTPEPRQSGEGMKQFFTNLAEGLKAMGQDGVAKGAFNLILAAPGLVAMVPGFLGAKLIERLDGEKLRTSLEGLGNGIKAFGDAVTLSALAKLAAAGLGFAVFTVGAIGLGAVALLGASAGAGLTALGNGLAAFGMSMQALGPAGLGYAAAGLLLLTGSLIGVGFALRLAAPGFLAIGMAMKLAFEGIGTIITALFGGLSQFLSVLTLEKAAALIAMGGAFVVLGGGLAALGVSALLGVAGLGVLGAISLMGPGLATAATAVSSMAASVGELSRALREITPESVENLKKVMEAGMEVSTGNAIANVSEPIMKLVGVLGGGSDTGENNQGQLLAKLDELIRVVKEGGNVYMDGQRVGQSLVLGSSKLS